MASLPGLTALRGWDTGLAGEAMSAMIVPTGLAGEAIKGPGLQAGKDPSHCSDRPGASAPARPVHTGTCGKQCKKCVKKWSKCVKKGQKVVKTVFVKERHCPCESGHSVKTVSKTVYFSVKLVSKQCQFWV